jgi:hypothetical protein
MTNIKRAGGVAQEVGYLPSKPEALNSNPSNIKGKKKRSRRSGACLESQLLRRQGWEDCSPSVAQAKARLKKTLKARRTVGVA